MERFVVENDVQREAEPHRMRVTLFRHGPAQYKQGRVSIAEAADLTEEGKAIVEEQALKLADELDKSEEIIIWSSPMGRTLETASILVRVLRDKGFKIVVKSTETGAELLPTPENAIHIVDEIEEVRGLHVELFIALVDGGQFTLKDGTTITFDKNVTNPNGHKFQEYYYNGGYKDFLKRVPDIHPEVRAILEAVEEEHSVHQRFDAVVRDLQSRSSKNKQRTILVTHHVAMKDYTESEVLPADYISL